MKGALLLSIQSQVLCSSWKKKLSDFIMVVSMKRHVLNEIFLMRFVCAAHPTTKKHFESNGLEETEFKL